MTPRAHGDFDGARCALLSCPTAQDPEWAPRAGGMLGEMLPDLGEVEAAAALADGAGFAALASILVFVLPRRLSR